jgi:Ca2+/H+ antiporter
LQPAGLDSLLPKIPNLVQFNSINMPAASIIFYAVFVIPMVAFLIWLMRQDKKKGITGLIVLAVMVIGVIVYNYVMTGGK